jgi:hypothetical protein
MRREDDEEGGRAAGRASSRSVQRQHDRTLHLKRNSYSQRTIDREPSTVVLSGSSESRKKMFEQLPSRESLSDMVTTAQRRIPRQNLLYQHPPQKRSAHNTSSEQPSSLDHVQRAYLFAEAWVTDSCAAGSLATQACRQGKRTTNYSPQRQT